MTEVAGETTFQRKIRERREAREAEEKAREAAKAVHPSFDKDLIPEQQHERSEEDLEMDRIINDIDIIDAYRRWCGKMNPEVKGRTEGIKISCPIPGHADRNPSAWINTEKQTWFCGACDTGGDAHDLAAFHFGANDYKTGANFHKLRRQMAEDFGYRFTRLPGNITVVTTVPEESDEAEEETELIPTGKPLPEEATVTELFGSNDDDDDFQVKLDWREIVPKNTFLDAYMKATCPDDVPEEYHFWNGLLAIGFALGRDVRLYDGEPVFGNLFVCVLGRSGAGKSRAQRHFDRLMHAALPYDEKNAHSKGMKNISSAASGEVLIASFMKPIEDPMNPKKIVDYSPVRGLIEYSELSGLVGRANRQGSSNIQHLQDFYDMKPEVSTVSVSGGTRTAKQPFASAFTTSQPKSLRGLLTQRDASSGFLNRWVFAPGTEKQRIIIGGAMIDTTPAVKPLQEILGWASSWLPNEFMTWSDEARERFSDFYQKQIDVDQKRDQQDLLGRIDLLMKKLVLLFTANRMLKVVPIESVEEAIKCYPYLISAYGIPASQISLTLFEEIQEKILSITKKHLEKSKTGMSRAEIVRATRSKKYDRKAVHDAIDILVRGNELEMVIQKSIGSVGRPVSERYRYKGVG